MIKIPKKLKILHHEFDVIRGKKYQGYFQFKDIENGNKPTIYITSDKIYELEVLIHETLEIALELSRCRYDRADENESYIFFYEHKQHDTISKIMTQVMSQIKIGGD